MPPLVYGPTYDEMLDPSLMPKDKRAQALAAVDEGRHLDPINLFNITWKDRQGRPRFVLLPQALTGVEAPICVLTGRFFPTGSHKVGATYSIAMESQLEGRIVPGQHTCVWPSTGNFGIGGAWVAPRMGYKSLVLLPAEMSRERFERIASYGSDYIATPGCESNVKEIYDACKEMARRPGHVVLNQFQETANYRFHYHVTGNSALDAARLLQGQGVGRGHAAAFISAMGSSGTIAAGDRLKDDDRRCLIVGLEPVQCPTLYENGFGGHDIQGIGDKHVTWIHNVMNMDALMCIDDMECKLGLQALAEAPGQEYLVQDLGVAAEQAATLGVTFGISGVCNILGAIKTARHYRLGKDDLIVTVATDSLDRYPSVLAQLTAAHGKPMTRACAASRHKRIFLNQKTDWVQEGTVHNRRRWHNLKYYTWVEQQGKTVAELNAQASQEWWQAERARIPEIVNRQKAARGF
jgi:cysteine synthase